MISRSRVCIYKEQRAGGTGTPDEITWGLVAQVGGRGFLVGGIKGSHGSQTERCPALQRTQRMCSTLHIVVHLLVYMQSSANGTYYSQVRL